jgi:phage replication O-like protein O
MDDSKSIFRDMIQTAIDLDLNKSELQVFLAVLKQTIGFGKVSDPLSYGRIAMIIHKRKDHVKEAIGRLLQTDLFDTAKHAYFDYTYSIGAAFLINHRGDFYTPTLPKTQAGYTKMEKFCEEQDTIEAISPKNNHPSQASDEPIAKPVSTASHPKQTESKHCCCQTGCGQDNSTPNKSDPSEVEVKAPSKTQTDNSTTQNTNSSNFDWTQTKMPILPKSIEAVNHAKIYAIFKQGTLDHAKNALSVFTEMESKKVIHSPTGLLISLSQSAQKGELTLPDTTPQVDLSKVPLSAAHLRYDPEQAEIDAQRIQERVNRQAKAKKAAEQVKQSTASQNSAETNSKAKQTEEDNFPSTGSLSSIMRHLHAKNKKYLKSLE